MWRDHRHPAVVHWYYTRCGDANTLLVLSVFPADPAFVVAPFLDSPLHSGRITPQFSTSLSVHYAISRPRDDETVWWLTDLLILKEHAVLFWDYINKILDEKFIIISCIRYTAGIRMAIINLGFNNPSDINHCHWIDIFFAHNSSLSSNKSIVSKSFNILRLSNIIWHKHLA